ncbi:MAG: hypothetical protein IPH52_27680 [Leptospiraceae bacterium]|nr:hypothetical protein [Leptospiraceae bacterium]
MKRPIILILCSHMLIFPMYVFTQSEDNTQNPAINETKPEERPVAEDKKTEPTSIEEKEPRRYYRKKCPKDFLKEKSV